MAGKRGGVVRVDLPSRGTHGWQGRVYWRERRERQTRCHTKFYADRKHGGTQRAFRKAVRWVHRQERLLGKPHAKTFVYPHHLRIPCWRCGTYLIRASRKHSTWCPNCYRNA